MIEPRSIPLLIAHRGESFDAPENTPASFALAWERGVDAIELDVHLTADQQLVVCHDPDTERTTGKRLIIQNERLSTLEQLGLCSLDDVLRAVPAGKTAFIEIKVGAEAVGPLKDLLNHHSRLARDFPVISFNQTTLRETSRQLPDQPLYLLIQQKRDAQTNAFAPSADEMIAQALDIGACGLDIGFNASIDEALVRKVHDAGLKLLVWTIDDPSDARRMCQIGVDGITTNRAAWMKRQLLQET